MGQRKSKIVPCDCDSDDSIDDITSPIKNCISITQFAPLPDSSSSDSSTCGSL